MMMLATHRVNKFNFYWVYTDDNHMALILQPVETSPATQQRRLEIPRISGLWPLPPKPPKHLRFCEAHSVPQGILETNMKYP